jgi:hypothetical protein
MMQFSLHLALMRPLATKFNGEKWIMFGTHIHEFQGYIKG